MIELTDGGTLDTVLRCSLCGEEFRGNYDVSMESGDDESQPEREQQALADYDEWVDSFIKDIAGEHECEPEESRTA